MARHASLTLAALAILLGCVAGGAAPGSVVVVAPQGPAAVPVELPNLSESLKFAVLGDFGNGTRQQFQLAEQMASLRERFPFELVITVGDNIYGSDTSQSFRQRFESPYKALLEADVQFRASLGNHDDREVQRNYEPFGMGGDFYYDFKAPKEDVRFFALESGYMTAEHIGWLQRGLREAREKWLIPYFHHPLYSSGGRHGSNTDLRAILEPLFLQHNVSVVFAGHDHVYERTRPQQGIVHFVVGSGGQLRRGNLDPRTGLTAKGFDSDLAFLAVEISGDEMYFNAISRTGQIVDSGVIVRRQPQ